MDEKEENLTQLVLTEREVALLSSLAGLGSRILTGDVEGSKLTLLLLNTAVAAWPEAMESLNGKMLTLAQVGMSHIIEETDETISR